MLRICDGRVVIVIGSLSLFHFRTLANFGADNLNIYSERSLTCIQDITSSSAIKSPEARSSLRIPALSLGCCCCCPTRASLQTIAGVSSTGSQSSWSLFWNSTHKQAFCDFEECKSEEQKKKKKKNDSFIALFNFSRSSRSQSREELLLLLC